MNMKIKDSISAVKKRRSLFDAPWRRQQVLGPPKPEGPPVAADIHQCPAKIDAVTQGRILWYLQTSNMKSLGHNRRTYVFAGQYVYQVYRDRDGLQQKSAFLITDMFPGGPRRVSSALSNIKSAVTVLIEYNTVYRFRWSKKNQRFYVSFYFMKYPD